MLNAIRVTKIEKAVNELLSYLPEYEPVSMHNVGKLFFNWQGLHIRYVGTDEFVLVFDSEEPTHTEKYAAKDQVRLALNKIWGGATNDIIRFSVFHYGYAVETRTDVFNGDVAVHEIRTGHLISDMGYRE